VLRFDWNPDKERRNHQKHGVSFAEAQTVFDDPLARVTDDPDHSAGELREIAIGFSSRGRLLLVSFSERKQTIRIISARAANARERRRHEKETL
jgi:uncharacterized protein